MSTSSFFVEAARSVARATLPPQVYEWVTERPFEGAEEATFVRALATKEPDASVRGPDVVARELLGMRWRLLLGSPFPIVRNLVRLRDTGGYCYHLARTKFFDAALLEGLDAGVTQVLCLGAGNDTRAYRFGAALARRSVFRARPPRHPVAQAASHSPALRAAAGQRALRPDRLRDPEHRRGPRRHGLRPRRPDLRAGGVSFFLSAEAVDDVLRFVREGCGPGSVLAFDYSLRGFVRGDRSTYGAETLARWLADHGVPYRFGRNPEEMRELLAARGFEVTSDIGPDELESRYLRRRDGSKVGRVWGNFRIAVARKMRL